MTVRYILGALVCGALIGCGNHMAPTGVVDPQVLAIPIQDEQEPLVDLRHQSVLAFGPSPEIPHNQDYTKMRQSVYDRLVAAQKALPQGLKLCLYEGYRSLGLQQKIFKKRYDELEGLHPAWTHKELFAETVKLVSPVKNLDGTHNVPPHATGGAVDVYLIDDNGHALDMGIHPADWAKDGDATLSPMDSRKVSKKARENRKIMADALTQAGFVNYGGEYWHWSYGDRYWAFHAGKPSAYYGVAG